MASKFTPGIRAALIQRISTGLTIEDACREADISSRTYKNWQRKAKEGDPEYAGFFIEISNARTAAEANTPMDKDELLTVVSKAARKGSVQAMKLRWDMLEAERKRQEADDAPEEKLSVIDELALRRRAALAGAANG